VTELIRARKADLETRAIEGELVLLDLRTQNYLSLNRTGAQLWPLMVEGVERSRLVQELQDRHHLSEEVAQRDIDTLVDQLQQEGLLEPERTGASTDAP
jgi:hypothetical protein